jgi:hypothetical protein
MPTASNAAVKAFSTKERVNEGLPTPSKKSGESAWAGYRRQSAANIAIGSGSLPDKVAKGDSW